MGPVREHPPVKLFFALLAQAGGTAFAEGLPRLEEAFGPLELPDAPFPFDCHSPYYAREFGTGLEKRLIAARDLIPPGQLPDAKIRTNAIERALARPAEPGEPVPRRRINIDPGYLTQAKVVLASTKDHWHRLYVGRGVFAEITLVYRRDPGAYQIQPWTYPDYQTPARLDYFGRLRERFSLQLAEWKTRTGATA